MSSTKRAASDSGLNPTALGRKVAEVLADPLYWFPVRHHSPTVARHVQSTIRQRKPRVVFIEAPSEANALVESLTDVHTVPPVAIYSSYRDDTNVLGLNGKLSPSPEIPARFSIWYPLTAYSPEYVAMKTAASIGAEVVFIDLPHHARIRPFEAEGETNRRPSVSPSPADDERLMIGSRFYQRLTELSGFKCWDEVWDTLFENPDSGNTEEYREELATFCYAARATADMDCEASEETIQRERHFLKVIRETLETRALDPDRAMVVCGGFHLFLDRNDASPPPRSPEGTVYTTVVPYSYFRISEMAGYGAGNRAPQFYQRCHELTAAGRSVDIALEHAIAVLREVRKGGTPLSTADAIAVTHQARMLAQLRGRLHTTLDDLQDSLITCCCKGDPAEEGKTLRQAMDAVAIGNRIGKVTSRLGQLPILRDFHSQLSDLELEEVVDQEKRRSLRLDRREALAARRSAFLHRLRFLEIPFAVRTGTGGDFSGTLFREDWQIKWDPRTEPALIEQNLYGDSVESAALNRLKEALAKCGSSAGRSCERLLQAIEMDLPNLVGEAERACGHAIDTDPSFASLVSALRHLALLDRYAEFRGFNRASLEAMMPRCYDRACFALADAIAVPEGEQAEVVGGLVSIAELLQRSSRDRFDRVLFAEAARRAADGTPVPFLRGAFLGLLCEIRELPAESLAAEVAGLARAAPDQMTTAGDLLDGMLAVSRTSILLGAEALVAALDELLSAAEWADFLVMLPRLRGAFERLSGPQRDSLAATVAHRYGLSSSAEVGRLPGGLGATARVARIDAAVAAALDAWPL